MQTKGSWAGQERCYDAVKHFLHVLEFLAVVFVQVREILVRIPVSAVLGVRVLVVRVRP